jgi:hypothetical protein
MATIATFRGHRRHGPRVLGLVADHWGLDTMLDVVTVLPLTATA